MNQNENAPGRIGVTQDPRRVSVSTEDREVMRALGEAVLCSVSQAARMKFGLVAVRHRGSAGRIDDALRLM